MCLYVQCFVDQVLTWVLTLTIICTHVFLLRCSHALMFTCFDIHILLCSHALMIKHFYVQMLWWSYISMFTCFDDQTLLCSNALMIIHFYVHMLWWLYVPSSTYFNKNTCPLAYMPSCPNARTRLWLDAPMLTWFVDIHSYDIHKHVHTLGC